MHGLFSPSFFSKNASDEGMFEGIEKMSKNVTLKSKRGGNPLKIFLETHQNPLKKRVF